MPLEKALCSNCRLEFAQDALFCPNCGTAKTRTNEDPLVGTMVGDRYQLLKQIGQGASGAIYLAEHVTLRRKLVVKVLHHELGRDDLAIERFRREATTVGELDNDHIVEIYDFGRTGDNRLYLAMEYLEGQTLADLIQEKGRLDTELVVDVLIQLGEALIEAHAMGYVHRDLRPRNMFLAIRRTHANYLKLLDFGLAKLVEQEGEAASTSLGMTFGDPHYMSPEQARGEPVDRRADIYSMGCIAYEMLTGQPPFHGGKVFDVLTRHVEEMPRPLGEVAPKTPAWLERAVMRCLSKSAEDRYITVYRFVEALRQGTDSGVIMSDEVAQSMPANPPASISRAMERLAARSSEQEEALPPLQGSSSSAAATVDAPKVQPVVIDDAQLNARTGSQTSLGLGMASALKNEQAKDAAPAAKDKVQSEASSFGKDRKKSDSVVAGGKDVVAGGKDRKKRESSVAPKAGGSANLSAVWYADGDSLEGGDSLSENDRDKLSRARGNTPSRTGLMAVSGDELYEEFGNSNRLKFVLGGVGVVIAAIVILAMSSGGNSTESTAKESGAAVPDKSTALAANATAPAGEVTAPAGEAPTLAGEAPTLADEAAAAAGESPALPPPLANGAAPVTAPVPVKVEPAHETKIRKPRERTPRERKPRERKPRERKPPADDPFAFDTEPRRDPVVKPPGLEPLDPFAGGPSDADKEQATRLVGEGTRDLQAGDILGAAGKFNKARALNPKSGQAVAGLGEIALTQGAYAAAAGHLGRASKMRPRSVRIWILLGEAYLGQSASDKAASAFKRALKLRPDSARARNGYNEATGN